MKTKHFLFALAAPLIAAACTNDEFADNAVNLDQRETISTEGFKLGAGFDNAQTRMGFGGEAGSESLTWKLDKTGAKTDRLGLCLILNNAAQTNYEYLVSTLYGTQDGDPYIVDQSGSFKPSVVAEEDKNYVTMVGNVATAPLAEFATVNATIFTGNYVAYYPYNKKFNEASATIPLTIEPLQVAGNLTDHNYVGNYAFYISDPYQIKGGDTEANFVMRQVLPILRFKMTNTGKTGNLEISKIEVTADGGMPVAANVDATFKGQVALGNIHVDASKNVDSQLLTLSTTLTADEGKKATYAYMTVMPGTYKNLKVRAILTDGNYIEKTFPNADLSTLNKIQEIGLPMSSAEVTTGDPFGQVVSAADFKKALESAAQEATGTVEINVLTSISGNAADLFPASTVTMQGAQVVVKGAEGVKLTVNNAYSSLAALKGVTFQIPVEFKNTYATNGNDMVTFAGATTFGGTVTVSAGSVLNIGGTATAKAAVTVGATTGTAATLNILEDGTLNASANVETAGTIAHNINVYGTLNLNGSNTTTSALDLKFASDVLTISGTLNIGAKGSASIKNGTWNIGNGTIVNNGTLSVVTKNAVAKKANESNLALTNNGILSVAKSDYDWSKNLVTIDNQGTYMLTDCTKDDLVTIVGSEDYPDVNGIKAALSNGDEVTISDKLLDMADYAVAFTLDATSGKNSATIKIADNSTWNIGSLSVNITGNASSIGTLKIQNTLSAEATGSVRANIGKLAISGEHAAANAIVEFAKNTDATVTATIGTFSLDKATLKKSGNTVTWKTVAGNINGTIEQ